MAAVPFFRHRQRCVLLIFLTANLAFTIARQVFDLMGYVWTPITANFLNIVFTIFAIFAAAQFRSKFFIVYICWTPIWLCWNSFLICYYLNVGLLKRDDSRYLSWGTGGQSWWNRHTPGCQRVYNATTATIEIGECKYLEPFYVEIIESIVHLVLTALILILVAIFLVNIPRKISGEPYNSLPRRRSTINRPHVTVEINPTPSSTSTNDLMVVNGGGSGSGGTPSTAAAASAANIADISFGRASDLSSGYLNVSYDASPAALKTSNAGVNVRSGAGGEPEEITSTNRPPPQPLQNYRRSSHRRRSSGGGGGGSTGSVQRRTREKSRERKRSGQHRQGNNDDVPSSFDQQHRSAPKPILLPAANHSSTAIARSRSNSVTTGVGSSAAHENNTQTDTIRTSTSRKSQRLSRPVQGLGDLLSAEIATCSPQQTLPQQHPAPPTETMLDSSDCSSPKQPPGARRQPIVRPAYKRGAAQTDVVDYCMEPRRIGGGASTTNGQPQRSSTTTTDPFRSSNPVRRSVISFDPKSDGDTLLRFHDHLGRSQETIRSRVSTSTQQQQPTTNQRHLFLAPDGVSCDSGFPPSQAGGANSDDDPRLSRDSQITATGGGQQRAAVVAQHHRQPPIGYEPAFMMSYEPANSQDDPIYRPSFLNSGRGGAGGNGARASAKFRYDDNNTGKNNFNRLPPAQPAAVLVNGVGGGYVDHDPDPDSPPFGAPNADHQRTTISGHGHAETNDAVSATNDFSESDTSSVTGLAVPRISNSSLLV